MVKLDNLISSMDIEGFNALILLKNENIFHVSGFMPSSFAIVLLTEEPILFVSSMDMELAKKNSIIPVTKFESFKQLKKILNNYKKNNSNSIFNVGVEKTLELEIFNILNKDFDISVCDLISTHRMIKTKYEIKLIEQATNIAQKSFKELDLIGREWEVAYNLGYLMRKNDAEKESFETIIASGSNSSLPHASTSNKELEYPILVDWGAYYNNYCSDNTRTIIQTERHEEILNIVHEAYKAAIKKIKVGVKASDVDKAARDVIAEYGYGDNFIHSTGHGIGLEVHEEPNISFRTDTLLEKNMVITIEPGIYFEGEFGIRLEDTIHVKNKAKVIGNLPLVL